MLQFYVCFILLYGNFAGTTSSSHSANVATVLSQSSDILLPQTSFDVNANDVLQTNTSVVSTRLNNSEKSEFIF